MRVAIGSRTLRLKSKSVGTPTVRGGGATAGHIGMVPSTEVADFVLEFPETQDQRGRMELGGKGDDFYFLVRDQTWNQLPIPSYQPDVWTEDAPPFNSEWTAHRNSAIRMSLVKFAIDYDALTIESGVSVAQSPLFPDTSNLQWTPLLGGQTGQWGLGYTFSDWSSGQGGGDSTWSATLIPDEDRVYMFYTRDQTVYSPGSSNVWEIYRSSGSSPRLTFSMSFSADGGTARGGMWEGAPSASGRDVLSMNEYSANVGGGSIPPTQIVNSDPAHSFLFDESGYHYRIGNLAQHSVIAPFDLASTVPIVTNPDQASGPIISSPQSLGIEEPNRYTLGPVSRVPGRLYSGTTSTSVYDSRRWSKDWLVFDAVDESFSFHQKGTSDTWQIKPLSWMVDDAIAPVTPAAVASHLTEGLDDPWTEHDNGSRWFPVHHRDSSSGLVIALIEYFLTPTVAWTGTILTLKCEITGTSLLIEGMDYCKGTPPWAGTFNIGPFSLVPQAGAAHALLGTTSAPRYFDTGRSTFEEKTDDEGRDVYEMTWLFPHGFGSLYHQTVRFGSITWERSSPRRAAQVGTARGQAGILQKTVRFR